MRLLWFWSILILVSGTCAAQEDYLLVLVSQRNAETIAEAARSFGQQYPAYRIGFANIMDVMLVFALGLMLALISQSQELQSHFELTEAQPVESGKELIDMPAAMKQGMQGQGMEPLGQVYRDPETGKLIMIGGE